MVLRKFGIHIQKSGTTNSVLLSSYINQLKWIRDLDIKPETIKLLEESVKEMLQDIRTRKEGPFWTRL